MQVCRHTQITQISRRYIESDGNWHQEITQNRLWILQVEQKPVASCHNMNNNKKNNRGKQQHLITHISLLPSWLKVKVNRSICHNDGGKKHSQLCFPVSLFNQTFPPTSQQSKINTGEIMKKYQCVPSLSLGEKISIGFPYCLSPFLFQSNRNKEPDEREWHHFLWRLSWQLASFPFPPVTSGSLPGKFDPDWERMMSIGRIESFGYQKVKRDWQVHHKIERRRCRRCSGNQVGSQREIFLSTFLQGIIG